MTGEFVEEPVDASRLRTTEGADRLVRVSGEEQGDARPAQLPQQHCLAVIDLGDVIANDEFDPLAHLGMSRRTAQHVDCPMDEPGVVEIPGLGEPVLVLGEDLAGDSPVVAPESSPLGCQLGTSYTSLTDGGGHEPHIGDELRVVAGGLELRGPFGTICRVNDVS